MATAQSDRRRRSSSGSTRRPNSSRRSNSSNGRKPLQGRDTGYRVGSSRRQTSSRSINPRIIIVGVVGILLIIALVFGITSCVKGCSSRNTKKDEAKEVKVNPEDKRVAYGVNAEQTDRLAEVLDRNEAFADIAKNADKITDERLIDLAIAEPEAVEFVAGSVKADGSTQPYDSAVPQGEYPKLYTFDPRWGYATYADGIIGSTGSGPVALSIASMGLSGKTTYDPATIAQAVTSAKLASGTTGMDDSFLTNHASEAGLAATSVEASSDGIYIPLAEDGVPVVIKLKSDSGIGSNNAHWAVVISLNSDNSVTVYDPTSAIATSHTWSLGAVASKTDTAYSVTAAAGTSGGTDASTNSDASLDGTGEDTGETTSDESA